MGLQGHIVGIYAGSMPTLINKIIVAKFLCNTLTRTNFWIKSNRLKCYLIRLQERQHRLWKHISDTMSCSNKMIKNIPILHIKEVFMFEDTSMKICSSTYCMDGWEIYIILLYAGHWHVIRVEEIWKEIKPSYWLTFVLPWQSPTSCFWQELPVLATR